MRINIMKIAVLYPPACKLLADIKLNKQKIIVGIIKINDPKSYLNLVKFNEMSNRKEKSTISFKNEKDKSTKVSPNDIKANINTNKIELICGKNFILSISDFKIN